MCGENRLKFVLGFMESGSSPRVRGKRVEVRDRLKRRGLIPACAGKTRPTVREGRQERAHPRVCGENFDATISTKFVVGSSPRVRGKLRLYTRPTGSRGLIPACAGKTSRERTARQPTEAHPRVCGENWSNFTTSIGEAGSSPRVRGKQSRRGPRNRIRGLIPACAGKTARSRERARDRWAHPRVCGENFATALTWYAFEGSSPRVRGKQLLQITHRIDSGLIPACAGKTA